LIETCIIVANGPSLNDVPSAFLSMYPTWGVNKIFMLENFRPTYYVTVHENMAPFAEQINALGAQMFVKDKIAPLFPGCQPLHSVTRRFFYQRPTSGKVWDVWEGWSVVYVCLQIAFWMGYRTVLLVGLDHDYSNGSFHPDYFAGVDTGKDDRAIHDQDKLLPAFHMARYEYARDNRHIINLTPGTKEPVFEKGQLEQWYP
jgi:hypothetical protein